LRKGTFAKFRYISLAAHGQLHGDKYGNMDYRFVPEPECRKSSVQAELHQQISSPKGVE
jgi:hypothetical protein